MKNKLKKLITKEGGATATALPQPEAMRVAYALVRPDPNQPRKTFSEDSLAKVGPKQGKLLEVPKKAKRQLRPNKAKKGKKS